MAGWIKLHRQIRENWIWEAKPFSKGQAWVDLILSANHEDKKVSIGTEIIEVKRGSFITSELKLMDRWGWSKSKVRAFLDLLQKDEMIVKKTDQKKTALTITNYNDYQEKETEKEPQKDRKKTTKRLQKDTNKNEKNEKNFKNNYKYIPPDSKPKNEKIFDIDSWEYKFANGLKGWILENNEKAKVPGDLQKWAKGFDMILRVDKREIEDVCEILIFSQQDKFWKTNILSPASLRKHFDKLMIQYKQTL